VIELTEQHDNCSINKQTEFGELLLHESCLDLSEYSFVPIRAANQMPLLQHKCSRTTQTQRMYTLHNKV